MKKIIALFLVLLLSSFSNASERILTIKAAELQRFSLAKQIPAIKNHDIRARKIVVASGGIIPEHPHTDRAGIVYVESGEIIEYRGTESRVLKAGDSLVEDFSTVHSYKNVGQEDCVLIAFDIPRSEK